MNIMKLLFLLMILGFSMVAFGDGGYACFGCPDGRPPGHADWWVEGDTTIGKPIRIEVMDSSVGTFSSARGQFGIGGIGPEFTPLMRSFHWPDSLAGEHFVLYIDGTYYSFVSFSTDQLILCGGTPVTVHQINDYFVESDTIITIDSVYEIHSHWQIPVGVGGLIDFYQILKPVTMSFGPDTCGQTRILFRAFNQDFAPHNIGVKLLIDAFIGTSDRPSIMIAGTYTTYSQFYKAPVPSYWQGADNPDLSVASAVARGILRGGDATPPDYFAIGQLQYISQYIWVRTDLGCHPDSEYWVSLFPGNPTGDVAFLVQWNPRSISAGAHFDWVTYYGFGSDWVPPAQMPISLMLPEISCHDCTLDTLITAYTLVTQHDASGNTYFNDTICISPPPPLTIDTVIWDTSFYGGHIINDSCILLDSLPADSTANIDWTIYIPPDLHTTGLVGDFGYYGNSGDVTEATDSFVTITIPSFTGIPPDMTLLSDTSFFVNCTDFTIDVEYSDDEGIDQTSVLPNVNGYSGAGFVVWHPPVDLTFDTFYVDVPGTLFTVDSLETVLVFIPPIADGCGCQSAETLRTRIIWDNEPPIITNFNPPDSGCATTSTPTIGFTVCDSISGVQIDSIRFFYTYGSDTISLTSTTAGIVRIPDADTHCVDISFTPTDIPSETTVTVCVTYAIDNVDASCSPNVADTTCWSFIVDYTAPDVEFITPPSSIYVSCDTPTVCFVVNDMNGFMTSPCESLVVWIESAAYNACDPNVSITGDTVCIHDAYNSPYVSGTEVNVSIVHLCDTLGNSIGTTTIADTFYMDTQGPWAASLDPPDSSFIMPPSPVSAPICSVLVNDDYAGISLDYVTVRMSINGGPDSVLRCPDDLSFSSGWLIVHSDLSDASYLDTVCFTLDTLFDNSDVCSPNNIDPPFNWCYIIDNEPPEAILVQPEDSSTWACGLGEGWICIDFIDIDDINPGSIVVTVGNSAPVSSGWLYYSDVDRFCGIIPIDATINSCEPVPIVVAQVADTLGNIALFADTFYFTPDLEGPYAGYMFPNAATTAEDSVVFEVIDDCSPISESQTCFEITVRNMGSTVGAITVCGDDPNINWFPGAYSSDDTAVFHIDDILDPLGMELGSGDSVYVCLVQSSDTLDDSICGYNGISDTTCLSFFYSLGGPSIAILDPPAGSSISCDSLCITFAFQDSDGVDSSTIRITYQINDGAIIPATIDSPFVSWISGTSLGDPDNLILCIPGILMDGDQITVSVDSVSDLLGVPNTAPRSGTYWMDWEPPVIGAYSPADWEEISTARPLIWATVSDLVAGVNPQSACFTFDGTTTFCWDDSIVYWNGDTVFFNSSDAGMFFNGGDTVEVCLDVADNATMCDSNVTDTCWHFTVSSGGPIVDAIEPAESSIITCDTIDSLVIIAADSNGVNLSTFHIVADGAGASYDITYPSSSIHTVGDTIIIDAVFADEGTVLVSVEVQDSLGNAISGGSYQYWFVVDHSAPYITEYTPLCDSTAMNIPETLWVIAEDAYGYPDPNMFCIGIIDTSGDTINVCGDTSSAIVGVGDTIFVILDSLGIAYAGGDTIIWWIEQFADHSDLCTPNYGEVGDTCRIPISSTGPDVSIIDPPDINGDGYIYFGCSYPYTFQFLLDDPDGFDTSSICVVYSCIDTGTGDTITTVSQCWPDPDLSVIGDTLFWDVLSFPCPAGNEMHITVQVLDNLLNQQRPNEFIVVIDTTAPGFEIISPVWAESVLTLTPDIVLRFPDPAGPDTNSICVRLMWNTLFMPPNTLEVCNSGDTIEWSGDTLTLHTPNGLFNTGDSVQICVDTVYDAADACPNWAFIDTCYWVFIAQGGPEAILVYPVPDSLGLVCANDSFVFVLSDPDGVDTSTVHFADDGTEHPIGTNPYWANETTLVYVPPSPYTWSPVYLSLWGMQDLLGYESDSTVFTLNMDVQPPVVSWVSPGTPPEPILIPPGVPPFQIHIVDSLNSVDSVTILFFPHGLDSVSYPVDATLGDGDTLTWDVITSILQYNSDVAADTFLAGDTDSVCVIVADNPNCAGYSNLDTTCWEYIVSATSGPIPTLILPERDSSTIACDSFIIEWSCYTLMHLRHSNAQVSLQIGAAGTPTIYDDASGAINYVGDTLIFAPPPSLFTDGDTIYVQIIHIEDALGNPTDSSDVYTFIIDRSGPAVISEYPTGSILDPHPTIWFYLDDLSPIDTASAVVSVTVNGGTPTIYRITDPEMLWSDDTMFIAGLEFSGGDTVLVCLDSIADIPDTCGPNWTTDTCFQFDLPQGGPTAELIYPRDSTTTFCADQNFVIALCDSQGVLFDSLEIYIQHGDGTIDSFDASHISNMALITHIVDDSTHCDTIIVPPLSSFADGETVQVTLAQVLDTLFNPGMSELWTFFIDLSSPVADNFVPADGSVIYDWSQHISAQVWDSISWLDTNAIGVLITDNGTPWLNYTWDSPEVWYDNSDSTVHIQIDSLWNEFHEYCIYLSVQDSTDTVLCPPNDTIIGWCFTVGDDDSTGPEIFVSDSCNWPAMSSNFFVACSLWDTSGIYDDATDTSGQGIFLVYDTAGCPNLSSGNYLGVVQMDYTAGDEFGGIAQTLPGAFPLFDAGTWLYYVIYAYDNDFDFDTTFDRTQAYSVCESCYFHDIVAPSIWADSPQDGWFYSCDCENQEIVIGFLDYDGFDVSAGTLEVNGVIYPFDTLLSSEISFTGSVALPGTTYLHFTPDTCWQDGETVSVRVWNWADIFGNIWEDSIYTYSFTVDLTPPTVYYEHCYDDTNLYIDQFDTLNIEITDELAGVNPDSIEVEIVGKHLEDGSYNPTYDYINPYTVYDNGVSYDDSSGMLTLIIPRLANLPIENEDSVWIVVSKSCDNARGCGSNCITDSMSCPKYIVAEFVCRSHPNPFTPNGDGSNDVVYIQFPKMVFRDATVYIYDMQGVELRKVTVGDAHSYTWDGMDSKGNACRPGVYLYVIKSGDEVICTGTLVLAR